jgi:hypothetical protein
MQCAPNTYERLIPFSFYNYSLPTLENFMSFYFENPINSLTVIRRSVLFMKSFASEP